MKTSHQGGEVVLLDDPRLTPGQRAAAIEDAAAGRGFLEEHIGGPEKRRELFRRGLSGRHVVVALFDGHYAGIASYKHRQQGSMAPRIGDFIRTFGWASFRPWLVFQIAEARLRSRGVYVCGLDVLPEFRRRGVATALMEKIVLIAGRLGAGVVELDVRMTNDKARALYHALGARPPTYPFFSLDRLNVSTTREFQRLVLTVGSDRNAARPTRRSQA